jgi:type II secretion system protein C
MNSFNRYREQVEPADVRRRWLIRWVAFIGSTVLVVVALWNAGVDPSKWYARLKQQARPPAQSAAATVGPRIPHAALPTQRLATATKLPGNNSSVSVTPQRLILTGTVLGRNFKEGSAMLGVARENPQTYAVGAVLANGARLTEIHAKYVVLERGGRSAQLYMDGGGLRSAARRDRDDVLSVGAMRQPVSVVAATTEPLTDYLRPTPIYDGEALIGYQVYPGSKSAAFAQMGLQVGDVITAIDAAPLSDPAQATEMFHELLNGAVLSAAITRKGKSEQLTLDGSLIFKEQERVKQAVMVLPNQSPTPGT